MPTATATDHAHGTCCDMRELTIRFDHLTQALKDHAKSMKEINADHETRLRALETRLLRLIAGAAALGVGTSFLPFT